jgi:hypothetical protein
MEGPVVLQEILGLRGPGGPTAGTLLPHRDAWAWLGRYQGAVLQIEVKQISPASPNGPTLRIETSVSENGPYTAIASYTAEGNYTLYLRRDPAGSADQQMAGYLRWAVVETSNTPAQPWSICFRITAMFESAV